MPPTADPTTISHRSDPEFPRPFGPYTLLTRIGAGGMGCVYRAAPAAGGPEVALKTPLSGPAPVSDAAKRFFREYQALARVRHPGFAPVLDFGTHDGTPYFVMAYVPGTPLADARPTDPRTAARVAAAIAAALQHAHDRGVIHRDLKPANVIIRPDGWPVVVDFGVARAPDPDLQTTPGTRLGTPRYMSPEQITGDPATIGPPTDVYGLGVLLYWMLTGQVPFDGPDFLRRILADSPVPPAALIPDLDPRLDAAVRKALAKGPGDRHRSMAAFAAELAPVVAADPPPAGGRVAGYAFVGPGTVAPAGVTGRLYLDVGCAARPGVVDHHHAGGWAGSTTRLVAARPELVRATGPVTVVLHDHPDLDCAAAAYLAAAYLATGELPPGAAALADYLDRADAGETMLSVRRPYTLYAAYRVLARRLGDEVAADHPRWERLVREGQALVGNVLAAAGGRPLDAVNAFDSPVMTRADRAALTDDAVRYERKLAAEATHARRATLTLPAAWGGTAAAEALFVRDVQTQDDPDRCVFFKDWARTDADRCPEAGGFPVLCVWMSRPFPRCIVSVRPGDDARLTGLAAALDAAETAARRGTPRERTAPPRPGYDNPDPWYDGRGHKDSIVDSPRDGTVLSADEVERLVLAFGRGTAVPL